MMASWDHYRSFLAVLGAGSLSAAARRLALTQPTLGRHISELEQDLGVILFTRTQSGLHPTEAALELGPYAEAMSGAADALVRAASGEAREDRGTVRVTASEIISIEVLPPILADFHERHPRIALELVVSNRNENLLQRDADIAVRMAPPEQATLVQRQLGSIELGLHAHRRYLDRHGEPASISDLASHVLIGFDQQLSNIGAMILAGLAPSRESFALRTDNDSAHLGAIRAGFGIGICQVMLARRDPNLVRILPTAFSHNLGCWLAMHEDLRTVLRMRLVFDHLAEALIAYRSGQHASR